MKGCISKRNNVSIMALILCRGPIQLAANSIIENISPTLDKFGSNFYYNQNNYFIKNTTIFLYNFDS